jgi:hypothetical protein
MNLTLTKAPEAPVIPDLDRPDADQIGDEILLESASRTKVGRVHGLRSGSMQSAEARAWTRSGSVD